MKRILAALVVVLVGASIASAQWTYVAPAPVVYGPTTVVANYWPVGPVYSYYPAPYVVARPVVAVPGPVVYGPAAVYYPGPYVVRARVFVPGQPIRNALRAAF
jgi:hypothetical protein